MATIKFKNTPASTVGSLPEIGTDAPSFSLATLSLGESSLDNFDGKNKVLNIFPSVDTGVCAQSVRQFNQDAAKMPNTVVLNISCDLPFAMARFCGAEGIENVEMLSAFRASFADDYGVRLTDTPLKGLCSRAVVVLSTDNKVLYTEQVAEITSEPNYEAAIKSLL